MDGQTIKINCKASEEVSLDELLDLQGNLKDLTSQNYEKLKNSIFEFGFSFPIFYWKDNEGKKYILDAHQRVRTLKKMRDEGFIIPNLPGDEIFANSKTEAKRKLLLLNSQYGKMTQEGFDEFSADIDIEEISDLLVLDEIMMKDDKEDSNGEGNGNTERDVKCPACGHEFKV